MSEDSGAKPVTKRRRSLVREAVETILLTAIIFLGVRLALQNFRVDGQSMEPNLHNNEYILVDKVDYLLHAPQRGDVVVFHAVPADQPDRDFIKRVIGLPGETVQVNRGAVYIGGKKLAEQYIHVAEDYTFGPKVVPRNDFFVLGDNRNNSFDSSKWTTTPWLDRKYIIGKALVAYWPPSDFTVFRSPGYSFP